MVKGRISISIFLESSYYCSNLEIGEWCGGDNSVNFECSIFPIFAFKEIDCDKLHQRKVGCSERGQFSFSLERQNPDTLACCHRHCHKMMRGDCHHGYNDSVGDIKKGDCVEAMLGPNQPNWPQM